MTNPAPVNYTRLRADLPALTTAVRANLKPYAAPKTPVVTKATFNEKMEQEDGSLVLSAAHSARYVFDHGARLEPLLDFMLMRGPEPEPDRDDPEYPDNLVAALLGAVWNVEGYGADGVVLLTCARLGVTDTRLAISLGLAGISPEEVIDTVENGQPLPDLDRLQTLAGLRGVQFQDG